MNLRWDPYFLRGDSEFHAFWRQYLGCQQRDILYVLGQGFDPRMCVGLKALLDVGGQGRRDCLLIEFIEGPGSPSARYSSRVAENRCVLEELLQRRGELRPTPLRMWSNEEVGRHRVSSLSATEIFSDASAFDQYTDIVIDINALPRSVYLSLIAKTMLILDNRRNTHPEKPALNLHVVVCESAVLDQNIRSIEVDDTAHYLRSCVNGMELESAEDITNIWIPVLGEGKKDHLERIHDLVKPEETYPVLPLPSFNPRRGDELLVEYRRSFDTWHVEPRSIIYAAENNPFQVYRQIRGAVLRSNRSLKPLGGCKAAVSTLSSKLLSVGALLAVYDLMQYDLPIGLAHIEAQGYEINAEVTDLSVDEGELYTMWITGECYEQC